MWMIHTSVMERMTATTVVTKKAVVSSFILYIDVDLHAYHMASLFLCYEYIECIYM